MTFFNRINFLNEANELQKDVMTKHFATDKSDDNVNLEKSIEKCIKGKNGEQCETVHNIYKCFWDEKVYRAPTPTVAAH